MIEVKTLIDGNLFIDEIKNAINNGQIKAWSVDMEGDYTRQDFWKDKAWIRCLPDANNQNLLRFVIIEPKNQRITKSVYGVYHGRFAEMLLTHFDNLISELYISPMLTEFDIFERVSEGASV